MARPDRRKLGKAAQKKGKYYEEKSCAFWTDQMGMKIIRTLGSGSKIGLPGDLLVVGGGCILNDFVADVKAEQELLTKRVLDYYQKNKEDGEGKMTFLELYVGAFQGGNPDVFVLISRRDFARIMVELNGYRNEALRKIENG